MTDRAFDATTDLFLVRRRFENNRLRSNEKEQAQKEILFFVKALNETAFTAFRHRTAVALFICRSSNHDENEARLSRRMTRETRGANMIKSIVAVAAIATASLAFATVAQAEDIPATPMNHGPMMMHGMGPAGEIFNLGMTPVNIVARPVIDATGAVVGATATAMNEPAAAPMMVKHHHHHRMMRHKHMMKKHMMMKKKMM